MAIYPRDFILLWRAKVDQKIDWKRSKRGQKNQRERKEAEIASSPHQSSQNTHALLHSLYIFKTPWASRSRNCSSASFRRRKCAFWWCVWETFWFFGRLFSGFFLSLSFFLYRANSFALSFLWAKEQRERGEIFESRWFLRARCVPPQRAALGCEARAWENETRLHARNMNASFDRIDSRGKDVEPTANLVGSFSKRVRRRSPSFA